MAAIIEKQHIAKRRKKHSFKPINKSAGFNPGFMSHFNQSAVRSKPDKAQKEKPQERPRLFPKRTSRLSGVKTKSSSGFSFSVPLLPTLAVIAGTVVISLAALNWEDIIVGLPRNTVYKPEADTGAERHTMMYAATGITNIMPSQNFITENEKAPEAEKTAVSNAPNDLITFEWQQYRVKRGDSVSAIAQKFGVSVGAIIASNEIRNARTLQEGALLRIPNIDGIPYQIKKGDSLSKIAVSFSVPLEVILDVNDIKSDVLKAGETLFIPGARMNDMDLRLSLGELFIYPVQSKYITSNYGMRKDPISGGLNFHTGLDLRADIGTTVVAALDGVVSVTAENWLYGRHIIISHDNGYKTLYGHLNSFSVKQGERVARGKKIGESGNTGYSTGPHLHFTIYDKNNKLVNPLDLLR
ncbi:MAG: peptidoglycan DD-metalloendopeptidase family protein [Treponema sp.]|jgi:murein DD-endopeptidase MepM/ murein hydrolase activator NlpD|nr:peptidoglycan DD-metalloendopeptidase family protein [Treponema sp.]